MIFFLLKQNNFRTVMQVHMIPAKQCYSLAQVIYHLNDFAFLFLNQIPVDNVQMISMKGKIFKIPLLTQHYFLLEEIHRNENRLVTEIYNGKR